MVSKKMFHFIHELQEMQFLATQSPQTVQLHSLDGSMIIDAKSYVGMYALNFSQPIIIVSDDELFHEKIRNIGENLE